MGCVLSAALPPRMLSVREEDYVVFEFARAEDRVRFENVAAALTVLLAVYVYYSGVTLC